MAVKGFKWVGVFYNMKAINKTNLIGEAKKDFLVALSCDQCYKYYAKFVASVKTFLTYWAPLM